MVCKTFLCVILKHNIVVANAGKVQKQKQVPCGEDKWM